MYVRQLSLLQFPVIFLLIDCLRLFVVVYKPILMLLVMFCMGLPAVIVTSAESYWYIYAILPEAICCRLETCNIYVMLLTLPCTCTYTPTFMVTTANIR